MFSAGSPTNGRRIVRVVGALILAGLGAYAFSFAVDLLAGGLLGVYPSTAFVPVITWSVIATVSLLFAVRLRPPVWAVLSPLVLFTGLSVLGAATGRHPHTWIVVAALLAQAGLIWRSRAQPLERGSAEGLES
jgi:hypothetical protein